MVCKDLTFGQQAAQLTHAAGQSARLASELPEDTHAVVLTVPDEQTLLALEARLVAAGISHSTFREPDLQGRATALGIAPQDRKPLRKLLGGLPLLR